MFVFPLERAIHPVVNCSTPALSHSVRDIGQAALSRSVRTDRDAESEATARRELHAGLVRVLAPHFGVDEPEAELDALALSIYGLIAYAYYGRDHITSVRPSLLDGDAAIEAWIDRLSS